MMRSITLSLFSLLLLSAGCTISFDGDDDEGHPFFPDAMHPDPVPDGGDVSDAHASPDAHWGGYPDAGKVWPDGGCCDFPDGGWWIPDASVPPDAYSPDAKTYPDAGYWPSDDAGYWPSDDAGSWPSDDGGAPHPGDAGCDI